MTSLNLLVVGAGGRMGAANIRAVAARPDAELVAACDRPGAAVIGTDAGLFAGIGPLGVLIDADLESGLDRADAVLDFTVPAFSVALAEKAAARGLVQVIGTTGFSPDEDEAIGKAARAGARIVKSGNMSLGVNLLASLVRKAAATLGPQFDIEIVEMHHRHKVDAPSGTALLLGEAAASGRSVALAEHSVRVRDGHTGPRVEGTIGFATLRGGTVVGEHDVVFAGPAERLVLAHRAEDRAIFANGALHAAFWARDKAPGLYGMADVLDL